MSVGEAIGRWPVAAPAARGRPARTRAGRRSRSARRRCGRASTRPSTSSSRSARTAPSAAASSSTSRTARSRTSRAIRRARSRAAGSARRARRRRATSQSPLREYKVKYRRPYGTRVGGALARRGDGDDRRARDRRRAPRPGRTTTEDGDPANRTMAIGNLGGATLDNEENYLIKKLCVGARHRPGREPGPHMTQLHGPQSGDLVRARRRDRLPAGPPELRLHRDHGLEHGREPPGRVPVGDGGRERGAKVIHVDPRFTRTSAMATKWVRHPRRHRHRVPRRDRQLHPRERALVRGVRQALHERAGDHRRGLPRTPRTSTGSSPAGIPRRASTTSTSWQYEGMEAHGAAGSASRASARAASRRATAGTAAGSQHGEPPEEDATLQHPRCVFQLLKKHYRALHAGVRRRDVRLLGRGLPRRLRGAAARTRAASGRARSATPSAGRSTRSASSTSAPPRSSSSCSGTWAGRAAASSRCAATRRSRARPTSRRSTTSCPATCRCRTPRRTATSTSFMRGEHVADRLVGQLQGVLGQPDEGVLRRRTRPTENDWLLRAAAADRRRQLRLLDGRCRCSTAR